MKLDIRKTVSLVLILIFVGSTAMMLKQMGNYQNGRTSYSSAAELSGLSESTREAQGPETQEQEVQHQTVQPENELPEKPEVQTAPETGKAEQATQPVEEVWIPEPVSDDSCVDTLLTTDLEALRQVNEDVIGWIMIPDTVINYPLLQGEDNHYYLDYTWDGQENRVGSIFMESTNSPDLSDFHTIIYGHNLKERTMFSPIRNYRKQDFWEAHPYVYIVSDAGVYRYEIYSSYEAGVTSDTYRLGFKEQGKQVFIDMGLEQSVIDTGVVPETTDRILTLSTCTGSGHETRWVVHARLKMVTESSLENRE